MGIRFYCPNGHKLNVKEFQAGRRGICPYCGAKIQIPLQSTRPSTREEMQAAAAIAAAGTAGPSPSGVPIPSAPLAVPGGMSSAGDSVASSSAAQSYQATPSWPASGATATASAVPATAPLPSALSSPAAGVYASAPMGPTGAIGGVAYPGGMGTDAAAYPSQTPSPVAAAPSPIYSSPAATEPAAPSAMGAMPSGVAGAPAADPYAVLGLNPVGAAAGTAASMATVGGVGSPLGAAPFGMTPGATPPAAAAVDPLIEAGAAVWYVRPAAGGQYGPAGPDVMRQWLAENRIAGDSLVWREGWRDWKTAAEVFPQLNPAAQINPFGSLGSETARSVAGGGSRVVLPRRSNNTLQLVLVIVLAIAVIVLGIVFYVVLTNDSGKPAPAGGSKPPATAPSGTTRPPAAAPGGSTKPPASTPGGPTAPSGPSAPGGQTSPAPPSNPSAPPAAGGTAPTTPPAPATATPSESSPTMPPASMSGG